MNGVLTRLREFAGYDGRYSYLVPRWIFLRLLATLTFIAFLGWFAEGRTLIGPEGLNPIGELKTQLVEKLGLARAIFETPSIFWVDSSLGSIFAVTLAGMVCSIALLLNVFPRAALLSMWLLYVSILSLAPKFQPAQLDMLLAEILLLSTFFAPRGARPGLGHSSPPHPFAVFSMRWLVLRLMFESGLTKLAGPDQGWFDFSIMKQVYLTAPYPTVLAFFAYHLPAAFHFCEVLLTCAAELLAPVLAIAGRRARIASIVIWIFFQAGIILTMNFGWLNIGALACGLLLLDDQLISKVWSSRSPGPAPGSPRNAVLRSALLVTLLSLHFYCTLVTLGRGALRLPAWSLSGPLYAPSEVFRPLRSANGYSLYYHTAPQRLEMSIEGSDDGGRTWREYRSRYQTQALDSMCRYFAPYFSRFDAAWVSYGHSSTKLDSIFTAVGQHLLKGERPVAQLFLEDPFAGAGHPPEAIRFQRYIYMYTDWDEWRSTGRYWKRHVSDERFPALVLDRTTGRISEQF